MNEPGITESVERTQSKLYLQHAGESSYSEKYAIAKPILLDGGRQSVKFMFPNDAAGIARLRFDVTECPAAIQLESMRPMDAAGDTAWGWDGDMAIFQNMGEIQIEKFDDSSNEATIFAFGSDPSFDFDLPPELMQKIGAN